MQYVGGNYTGGKEGSRGHDGSMETCDWIYLNTEALKKTYRMDNLEIPEIICLCFESTGNH